MKNIISVKGAKHHNLKDIDFDVPKNTFTVITGPSGSGKSTIAIGILYAEGQRRYIDSLPSYARQFLGNPEKPDVEEITGLCPAVAIDQKTVSSNLRSTVGTVTEIYEYLRVLYATIGEYTCTKCNAPVKPGTPGQIAENIVNEFKNIIVDVLVPIARQEKGTFSKEFIQYIESGYKRFYVNDELVVLRTKSDIDRLDLKKTYKQTIYALQERVKVDDLSKSILEEAIKHIFEKHSLCSIRVSKRDNVAEFHTFSQELICTDCGFSMQKLDARHFSFNSPLGACTICKGIGVIQSIDFDFNMFDAEDSKSTSGQRFQECPECHGARLHKKTLSVLVKEKNIFQCSSMSIDEISAFIKDVRKKISKDIYEISRRLFTEIEARLGFLENVGLSYLTLMRTSTTLSGGEAQRIRLATQIGSGLSGVMYVLDEPSIGLHQRDNSRLIKTMKHLQNLGNTLVIIEHDADTMLQADHIIDVGPGAGQHGGLIVSAGSPKEIMKDKKSVTGQYLSKKRRIERKHDIRKAKYFLHIKDAHLHNLQNVSVDIPLDVLCCVSGVSGSGKSSLVMGELVPLLHHGLSSKERRLSKTLALHGRSTQLSGHQHLRHMVVIDQKPIGRTPRSNPATYLGIFDLIRALYASLPESKARGYAPGNFSFNVAKGRCRKCDGRGNITYEMYLLPPVEVTCGLCSGTGYSPAILEILYKEKNISDILRMTAEEAYGFFEHHMSIAKKLKLMLDVGLGYLKLGQSSLTLSGGEAQRIKLADELAKRGQNTLYILDEPTTGLHFQDIERLLKIFDALIEKGNSVLVIEHNTDVLAYSDYLIDIGPEGGKHGGHIVATGSPEKVSKNAKSITGKYISQ